MTDFRARITAELDTSKVERDLKKLNDQKIKVSVGTNNASKNIDNIGNTIKKAEKTSKSFGDTLKRSLNIGTAASITAGGFRAINKAANEAVEAVKNFDKAITKLRMATNDSYDKVRELVANYNQLGQEIGAVTLDVSDGANAWLRQGHNIADTNTLIRDSMILSKVAELESADATEYLTSAMKGYNVAVNDVISIVDKLTSVDLVSATDAGGLAEAMSKTAVSANSAGVSIDKLLGYLAATGEVTQENMAVIGNAYKTFFARYSAIKAGKLELVDEDGTIEVLSDVEQSLKNVGIDIRSTITEFDNAGDVLDNLASKWDTLNSVQQSAIASAFGGTRQKERFLILMENYDKATEYMETSINSAGKATEKFNAYLDSIEAKTATLQAAFESLAFNGISTESVGVIIDATTALVKFADKTNVLKGTFVGLAVLGAVKAFLALKTGIASTTIKLNEFNAALKLLKTGNIGNIEIQRLAQLTVNLSQSQLKAVLSSKALTAEQRIAILTAQGMSQEEAKATLSTMGLATAQGVATGATNTLSGALKGLWATIVANPLGLVVTAVTAVVSIYTTMKQKAEEAKEEARRASIESANAASTLSDELTTLAGKYIELSEAIKTDKSVKESLISTQDNLIEKLGLEQDELDKLIQKYGSLTDAIKAATVEELQKAEIDLRAGLNTNAETLIDKANSDKVGNLVKSSMNTIDIAMPDTREEQIELQKGLQALINAGYGDAIWTDTRTDGNGTKYSLGANIRFGNNNELQTVEGVIAAHERLSEVLGIVGDTIGSDNELYKKLYNSYNACTAAINDYEGSLISLNNNLAQQYVNSALLGKQLPTTQEAFESLRQVVLTAALDSGEFVGDQTDIENAIDRALKQFPDFSQYYTIETPTESNTDVVATTFEQAYKEHQHYLAMDKESLSDYLSWLKGAYKAAYETGEIELDDYYKYQEEVYEKTRELFEDYVNDDEHQIDLLSHHKGNESEIIASYQRLQAALHAEANKYRAMGLDENSEHIQELQNQWWDYEEKIANVFKTGFDDIQKSYSDRIGQIEHLQTTANNALESMETLGLIESGKYYDQLITTEKEKISLLEEQYTELVEKLTEGIATGIIAKGSEDFNDMSSSINSVAEELQSAKIALDGYSNSLRQLDWDRFDYLQDEISKITDESDYLLDLMGSKSLTDESGNLNEYGDATVGLHGLNYNVYLHQAQQYADEIARIEKDLAENQYNQDLIERKEELLELQREMVLAAEDEKQAIIDLVQEGIDAELESLQELIDKYKDAIDSAKDLYDYQNKVADATEEISKLQKMIVAYENDTSEEAKAEIQKLKVDLEKAQKELQETEYDQFIADQKKLLDNIYTSHEQNLNQRIDDVDSLIEESINAINDNSSDIRSTLEMVSETAGTKLSNHMESIWSTSGGVGDVISTFNSDFDSSMTTVSSTLADIKEYVSAIKTNSDNFDFVNYEPEDFSDVEVITLEPVVPEWSGNTDPEIVVADEEELKKILGGGHDSFISGFGSSKVTVKQFADGGRVDETGLAWLDGTKSRPEYVLNPDQTEWLFEAAKAQKDISVANPYGINYEAVKSMLPGYVGHAFSREIVSKIINNTSNTENFKQEISINIDHLMEIDHVENYEDIVTKLQHDNKFEKMIQSITIGRINGGNPLDKYQYKWK